MLVAVGRARKDAKALSHAVNCDTLSLGGIKSVKDVDLSLFEKKIPIFFFGRDEIDLALDIEEEIRKINPIYQIVIVSKKAVRNTRMEEIREAFEMAKAKLRLGFKFDEEVFLFSNKNELGIEIHPDYDAYFIVGKKFVRNMRDVFGIDVEEGNLILRKLYNEEWIYTPKLKAVISKKIGEPLKVKRCEDVEVKRVDIDKMIEKNRRWLEKLEEISLEFIRRNVKGEAGVPVSGGKDSTATLILAKKALDDVKALYVKVSHEMPYTEEYVNYICERLDVELVKSEVKFDVDKRGLPTHANRWCTQLKMEGLRKIATETLIVGDREAESRIRRERPEIMERISREIFPIKYWSGCAVQLYILMNGLKLHPLYYEGFYRLGCTICPSLSEWERLLLKNFIS